jgi:hypothetical protein
VRSTDIGSSALRGRTSLAVLCTGSMVGQRLTALSISPITHETQVAQTTGSKKLKKGDSQAKQQPRQESLTAGNWMRSGGNKGAGKQRRPLRIKRHRSRDGQHSRQFGVLGTSRMMKGG